MPKHLSPDDTVWTQAASATECTGMQTVVPETEQQANSYSDIMALKIGPEGRKKDLKTGKHSRKT